MPKPSSPALRVTVTGGAGFIGTALTRRLLHEGCNVTVLDSFEAQVHGSMRPQRLASDIASDVRLVVGNVRDEGLVTEALRDAQVVVHLAAETGTGQSMYELTKYADTNVGGTARILEHLIKQRPQTTQTLVVASSRAIYGEGKVNCNAHGAVFPAQRQVRDLSQGQFEARCPLCDSFTTSLPTDEGSPPNPVSFYGLTKLVQEQAAAMVAQSLGLPTYSLRFQNVYGPGQSLSNPYTGILAIFANEIRLSRPVELFEDGQSTRDFVYIDDVVEAIWRCLGRNTLERQTLNVGSGVPSTVAQIASQLQDALGTSVPVTVSGAFRVGDIRHAVADLKRCSEVLGFQPKWSLDRGISTFVEWLLEQPVEPSRYRQSLEEIHSQGLMQPGARGALADPTKTQPARETR